MIAAGAIMTCLMRGTVADIMQTQDGRRLMLDAMAECQAVAQLCGHPIPEPVSDAIQGRLLDSSSTWAASMMRDIAQGAPRIEADAIVGDLVACAAERGRDLPLSRRPIATCRSMNVNALPNRLQADRTSLRLQASRHDHFFVFAAAHGRPRAGAHHQQSRQAQRHRG
jgi:hypothetical protein